MPTLLTLAALAALTTMADPPKQKPKQSWEATQTPEVRAAILPRSALVEVDGKAQPRGFVVYEVADPTRAYHIKISAEGFEPAEATVPAAGLANRDVALALRPAGFEGPVKPEDAPSMALAASALWRAGRTDDAADYAEQSLRRGNTALANRVLGDVWRQRGNRDEAVRFYTGYLSLAEHPRDVEEIRAYLLQDRPGDITIPGK